MSIREFTIGFSRTINLGGYESARVEASITCQTSLGPGESSGEDYAILVDAAQQKLTGLLQTTWNAQKDTIKGRKETA